MSHDLIGDALHAKEILSLVVRSESFADNNIASTGGRDQAHWFYRRTLLSCCQGFRCCEPAWLRIYRQCISCQTVPLFPEIGGRFNGSKCLSSRLPRNMTRTTRAHLYHDLNSPCYAQRPPGRWVDDFIPFELKAFQASGISPLLVGEKDPGHMSR